MNNYQELVYEIAVIRGNIARMESLLPNATFAEAEELSDAIVELNAELDDAIDYLTPTTQKVTLTQALAL